MKTGLDEKRKELARLLSSFVQLRADIHYVPEQMAITVAIPPPWNDAVETDALVAQKRILEWSAQYPELVCYCFDSFSTLLYVLK